MIKLRAEHSFCSERLDFAPLQSRLCAFDGAARNMIIFAYLLAFLLFLLVGFLTLWNCWLISKGFTYIDYLVNFLKVLIRVCSTVRSFQAIYFYGLDERIAETCAKIVVGGNRTRDLRSLSDALTD